MSSTKVPTGLPVYLWYLNLTLLAVVTMFGVLMLQICSIFVTVMGLCATSLVVAGPVELVSELTFGP